MNHNRVKAEHPCADCGKPIYYDTDYYMVHNALWCKAFHRKYVDYGDDGDSCPNVMLHLACLEKRLGRKLRRKDFPADVPVNNGWFGFHRETVPE